MSHTRWDITDADRAQVGYQEARRAYLFDRAVRDACGERLVAVDLSFYKSYISERIRDEGRAEGAVRRAAEDVLDILEVRAIDIPEAVRERITGCGDPEILRHWHRRAVTAPTAEDVFTDE